MSTKRARLTAVGSLNDAKSTVHVGQHLRQLRERIGLSQEVAAVHAGLTRNTLGRLEAHPLPDMRLSTLFALMEIYDVATVEELLGTLPSRAVLRVWVAEGRPGLRAASR